MLTGLLQPVRDPVVCVGCGVEDGGVFLKSASKTLGAGVDLGVDSKELVPELRLGTLGDDTNCCRSPDPDPI
jgi:hypothetical protein